MSKPLSSSTYCISILNALTGVMAESERLIVEATQLAVKASGR